ncbi:DUF2059 domain-containing protein [Brevundimonas sp.]|uniref:DUF2059 domain-containing protein n=1 Tax=Brevundimonas sp. TaxID=1871086 RepID=UPI00391C063F
MRFILTIILGLALTTTAAAQEADAPQTMVIPAEDDAVVRRELAERYVELAQGDSLAEMAQAFVDGLIDADTQSLPEHREWFRTNVPREMANLMILVMDGLIPIYAERLTAEELMALITFYETPLGQSIARKEMQIGMDQSMAVEVAVMQFQVDLMRKFCTAFDCTEPAASGPRPDKRGVQRN